MSLHARDIALELSGVKLLEGIDLSVKPGEVTAVLGPNGAGKTSLLRVLCGELLPMAGDVSLAGEPIGHWSSVERARRLAVLPQHSLLDFPFFGEEVVMLGRTPHDTGREHDEAVVRQALEAVDGTHLARRVYTHLSGGEKQRIQLARVLAQVWEPVAGAERFLVLDEPTSSLDLAHQRLTLATVRRLAERGVGILVVLHDLNLAARCADTLVLLQCGRMAFAGAPADVLTVDNIQQVFDVQASIGVHPVDGSPLVIT
ncbi:MAG: heme ABC transporter ATP-binding protein [Halioglobus sp.]